MVKPESTNNQTNCFSGTKITESTQSILPTRDHADGGNFQLSE
jgi:hypothetical protein